MKRVHLANPRRGGVTICGKPVAHKGALIGRWRAATCWDCIFKRLCMGHPRHWRPCICMAPKAVWLAGNDCTIQDGSYLCTVCFRTRGRAPAVKRDYTVYARVLCALGCGHYHSRYNDGARCTVCGCTWLRYASGGVPPAEVRHG